MPQLGCFLYLITPARIDDPYAFATQAEEALSVGGVRALQVRLKDAGDDEIARLVERLKPLCRAHDVSLILNDRPDLAAALDCDGVHVGQDDAPLAEARRIVGRDRIVGVTCHDSRHLAMEAAEGGADYVAFGAFYPTTTKETVHRPEPEILEIWQETMLIPCVAIGGITPRNAEPLVAAGADFLAVSSAVWAAPEGVEAAVRAFADPIARGLAARKG